MGAESPPAVAAPVAQGAPPMPEQTVAPDRDSVRPVSMPVIDRLASGVVTAAPPILVALGMWLGWSHGLLVWQDLLVLAVCYMVVGSGISVGFHRLLTHRSFKTGRLTRAAFAALGSAAAEGPVIDWVATHRKHHQFSDAEGDPHSPHLDDRTFVLWVAVGLAAAFGLGVALTGTVQGGLTALLWGGAARIFFMHHATFSINSVCHYFGRHDYDTGDESRNVFWLAIPTWGEAWHNNHHAFPTSYRHGLQRWQLDPSAAIIRLLEMTGLAWDVVRIDPARRDRRLIAAQDA